MTGVLRRLSEFANTKKIRLLLLVQPSSKDLTTNSRPNYADFLHYPLYRRDRMTQVIEEAARLQNLEVVNLFNTFSGNTPQRLYLPGNEDHWSEEGQQLAAHAVALYLLTKRPPIAHRPVA
jgi:hypothetical protein